MKSHIANLPFGLSLILCMSVLAGIIGCAGQTADPAYVQANRARLTAVAPMLSTYGNDHPASKSNADDIVAAWKIEVAAQAKNAPATLPTK